MAVTLSCYPTDVTIKQVLVGMLVGSSIIGLTLHRVYSYKDISVQLPPSVAPMLTQHKRHQARKLASHHHKNRNSNTQLSSRKLVG